MFLSSPKQTKCTLENDVIHHCKHETIISCSTRITEETYRKHNNKGRSPSNGYTIFGNKSYSYIDSQISVHRKHEIIVQRDIWNRFPVYIKTMRSCSSMFDTSSQSFQRQDDQEVDAHHVSPFQYHQGSYYVNPCYHAWHAFFFSRVSHHFSPMAIKIYHFWEFHK
jgi:hypothetical protein